MADRRNLGPDGRPALDVLIGGRRPVGRHSGVWATCARRSPIYCCSTKREEGREGPWLTYARMPTLRSPKHFTGPWILISRALTYQLLARSARSARRIGRTLDYAFRADSGRNICSGSGRSLDVPVRNGCEVLEIGPAARWLASQPPCKRLVAPIIIFARKIVLVTGQEGMGDWTIPEPTAAKLPPSLLCECSRDLSTS